MKIGLQSSLAVIASLLALDAESMTASDIYDAMSPSIVIVETYGFSGELLRFGSGVVLPDNTIATNCHVVEGASKLEVRYRSGRYLSTLRHSDGEQDVCILAADGLSAPAVMFGSTGGLRVGARVYAIGAPKGLDLTLSEGIVSSPVESGKYLQISAPISPGSSGGGLFDEEGRLIGLPTFYLTEGQLLNFAVPVEWVIELPKRHADLSRRSRSEGILTDWVNKAIALEYYEDWEGLLDHALRWTSAQPLNASAWLRLGQAYGKAGLADMEIEAYKQALHINPDHAKAWQYLAGAYKNSGQSEKAREAYSQSLRLHPDGAEIWLKAVDR